MKLWIASPNNRIFSVSLIVYLITAFFSQGYHHPDEHFQILEFCNYKLGLSPATDLPWEFNEKIRPAVQPALAYGIIQLLNFATIHNPFTYALVLRILTALLSWFLVCKFSLLLLKDFSTAAGKNIFLCLSFFLWFIPYISVRFSSENYAALTFFGALYLILLCSDKDSKTNYLKLGIAGLLLGFSFYFRFQIGFSILGLGLWMVFIRKVNRTTILMLILSGIVAICFCVVLDYWFYGSFVLTPVRYFLANIIDNKAALWGSHPWWYYFPLFFLQAFPPISLLLLLFFLFGLYKKPTNIFSWCLIPFIIAHMVTGHKEMRFMFPIVFGFIYMASLGIDAFISLDKLKKTGRILFVLAAGINIPLLIGRSLFPAQEAISYYNYLYTYYGNRESVVLCNKINIYKLAGLQVNFYNPANEKIIVLQDDDEISNYLKTNQPDSIFLIETNKPDQENFPGYKKIIAYDPVPEWIPDINHWKKRSSIWHILELIRISDN